MASSRHSDSVWKNGESTRVAMPRSTLDAPREAPEVATVVVVTEPAAEAVTLTWIRGCPQVVRNPVVDQELLTSVLGCSMAATGWRSTPRIPLPGPAITSPAR